MRIHTKFTVLDIIIMTWVLACGSALAAEKPADTDKPAAISGTRQASCLLRITSDPAVLPLTPEVVEFLLRSSGVAGRAARDVGIFDAGIELEELFELEFSPLAKGPDSKAERIKRDPYRPPDPMLIRGEHMLLGRLEVRVDVKKLVAEELLATICKNLRLALAHAHGSDLAALAERRNLAEEEFARAQDRMRRLQDVQRHLSKEAGQSNFSRAKLVGLIEDLEREKHKIAMEQAAMEARQAEIERQIAKVGRRVADEGKDDLIIGEYKTIIAEYQRIIKTAEAEIPRLEQLADAGQIPISDLQKARERLDGRRLDLVRHRQDFLRSSTAKILRKWNDELATLSIETATLHGRLGHIKGQLARVEEKHLLELADQFELETALQLPLAREAVEQAIRWRDELARQMRMIRPARVTVIGGK